MRAIRQTLFLTLFLLGSVPAMAQSSASKSQYVFSPETAVFIDGTSSLHDWTCNVKKSTGSFTSGSTSAASPTYIESGTFSVEIADIECGKNAMNKKVREALGVNKATNMTFVLTSATTTPAANGAFKADLKGSLKMAGVTKPINVIASGKSLTNNQIQFEGSIDIVMSDYGIDPPTALLGTLHTGDKVTVRFKAVSRLK